MTHKEVRKKRYYELKEKYPSTEKSETITIRVTPFIKKLLEEFAKESGTTQTSIITNYLFIKWNKIMEYRGYGAE